MDDTNLLSITLVLICTLIAIAVLCWRIEKKEEMISSQADIIMMLCSLIISQNAAESDKLKKYNNDTDEDGIEVKYDDNNGLSITGNEKYEKLFSYLIGDAKSRTR